jgi:hypothetical protein
MLYYIFTLEIHIWIFAVLKDTSTKLSSWKSLSVSLKMCLKSFWSLAFSTFFVFYQAYINYVTFRNVYVVHYDHISKLKGKIWNSLMLRSEMLYTSKLRWRIGKFYYHRIWQRKKSIFLMCPNFELRNCINVCIVDQIMPKVYSCD